MINLEEITNHFQGNSKFDKILQLKSVCETAFQHGDAPKWQTLLSRLPKVSHCEFDFNSDFVSLTSEDIGSNFELELREILMGFHPWRKGPYNFFGIKIDAEWRSDLKWVRVKNKITPLDGRTVLDVGCGNAYHCWRMLGAGAGAVIGLEPYLLSVFQFSIFKKYSPDSPVWVLPLKLEQFPDNFGQFDTVFSMGVFYHQRSPFDHLAQLKAALRKGGELVLETLVIEGDDGKVFVPKGRYAKMRNVWFIPSTLTLESWLKRAGFSNIELIDLTKTTAEEQRKTEWMTYESLDNFLNPQDELKTIEGCPAPVRAIFKAQK